MGDYYRGGGYRGGWRGGGGGPGPGRGRGRYNNDQTYQGGGRYYDDGYQGGRGPPRGGGYQGGGYPPGPPARGGGGYYDEGRGGGRGGGYNQDNYYQGPCGGGDGGGGGRGRGRGRYNWGRGGGRSGPPPAQRRRDTLPDDITQLTELKKHEKQVTCLYYDPQSQQLYSGSSDGIICAWSCSTGQLVSSDVVAPFGCDSIRVCNNFMFVGMSREDEGIVKVYNLAAGGQSHQLTGHKGQVYSMAFANNTLFTAGQDTTIRVWNLNEQAGIFVSQAILNSATADGHKHGVHALMLIGQHLFSGDRAGTLKVWDLAQGACVQTVARAHNNAITSIMMWSESFLLTSSMDGTIKIWSPGSGAGGEVINPLPEFKYPEEEGPSAGGGGRGGYRQPEHPGIITMSSTADHGQKSVLMLATVRDSSVKLLELPTFAERGVLPDVYDCRALAAIPEHHIMLAGERNGGIKIFQWKG